jgi:hypothetical protein
MLLSWLAQAASDPTGGIWLQYGAIGAVASLSTWAVYFLYRRQERQHELEREQWKSMYEGEKERADRMEKNLIALYDRLGGEFANKLVESTSAMREFAEIMNRRGDR